MDNDGGVSAVLVICFRGLFGLEMVAGLCGEQALRIGPITFCPRRTCGGKGNKPFASFTLLSTNPSTSPSNSPTQLFGDSLIY